MSMSLRVFAASRKIGEDLLGFFMKDRPHWKLTRGRWTPAGLELSQWLMLFGWSGTNGFSIFIAAHRTTVSHHIEKLIIYKKRCVCVVLLLLTGHIILIQNSNKQAHIRMSMFTQALALMSLPKRRWFQTFLTVFKDSCHTWSRGASEGSRKPFGSSGCHLLCPNSIIPSSF